MDDPALRAGAGRVALFAVARPPVPPRCVVAARLRLFLERSSDLGAEEPAVRAASTESSSPLHLRVTARGDCGS